MTTAGKVLANGKIGKKKRIVSGFLFIAAAGKLGFVTFTKALRAFIRWLPRRSSLLMKSTTALVGNKSDSRKSE